MRYVALNGCWCWYVRPGTNVTTYLDTDPGNPDCPQHGGTR